MRTALTLIQQLNLHHWRNLDMKSILRNLRPLRVLVSLCVCAVLLLAAIPASPAFAASKIEQPANRVAEDYDLRSREALKDGGVSAPMPELQQQQEGGLNEVQGKAGKDELKRPSNSKGTTIEKQIEKALDGVHDKVEDTIK